ncbi:MAG: hypothetical protein IH820_11755, partial [Bacteroidetes bacterium]|nr:hypothetical protein [Bacteroidota bacterium]
ALAFKIATDPFVGSLTFFRVYSGVLKSGDTVYNPVKGRKERIIPIHQAAVSAIQDYLAQGRPQRQSSRSAGSVFSP